MLRLQNVQSHTGLAHFFDIRALWRCARVPEYQKIKYGGLDQYDPERFGKIATIRKKCGNYLEDDC